MLMSHVSHETYTINTSEPHYELIFMFKLKQQHKFSLNLCNLFLEGRNFQGESD